jgi:hypothetical protein
MRYKFTNKFTLIKQFVRNVIELYLFRDYNYSPIGFLIILFISNYLRGGFFYKLYFHSNILYIILRIGFSFSNKI